MIDAHASAMIAAVACESNWTETASAVQSTRRALRARTPILNATTAVGILLKMHRRMSIIDPTHCQPFWPTRSRN